MKQPSINQPPTEVIGSFGWVMDAMYMLKIVSWSDLNYSRGIRSRGFTAVLFLWWMCISLSVVHT